MARPPFETVLIANRGEIAVRVIRTCRRLGIRTIAVYSDGDARSPHVTEADEAHRIGPAPASESYLNISTILDVARRSGARALHPGYGFLAENPDFAQACLDAGVTWIGPPPTAMRAIGDKARAKQLAEQHGVPLLPGYHGSNQDRATLQHEADRIGFPVLIKASAGGGGRGMRIVNSADEFAEALEAARREAKAAFGDDRVLLERYVRKPRHVEVQILADQHGNVIHLGERECSVQRRHQKLIEESPSPAVDDALRERMGASAIALARAAGYTNAGTVEFLLDEAGSFSFLEVNARLQVEHPVTEALTGLDMVELQLKIAAGEPLPLSQEEVTLDGHAIEVRVVAEDPLAGWAPSSGTIDAFYFPPSVRCDTWVMPGTVVSPYYDSLLAKVIVFGSTRREALGRMVQALSEAQIEGVRDNVDLLLGTIQHPAFVAGELHTGFLDEHAIIDEVGSLPDEVLAAAAAQGPVPWRLGRIEQPFEVLRAGRLYRATVSARLDGDGVDVQIGSRSLTIRTPTMPRRPIYRLRKPPPLSIQDTLGDRGASAGSGRLTAPMPGKIVKIAVQQGDHVRPNQLLVVLEAMKMEHVVDAPHAGVIQQVCVELGQQVQGGTVLVELGDVD